MWVAAERHQNKIDIRSVFIITALFDHVPIFRLDNRTGVEDHISVELFGNL